MQILQILYKCCKYCKHCWIANSQGQTFPKGYFLRFQRGSWSFKGHWGEVSCLNHHEDYCQTFLAIYVIFSGKFGVRAGNRIGGGAVWITKGITASDYHSTPHPQIMDQWHKLGKWAATTCINDHTTDMHAKAKDQLILRKSQAARCINILMH